MLHIEDKISRIIYLQQKKRHICEFQLFKSLKLLCIAYLKVSLCTRYEIVTCNFGQKYLEIIKHFLTDANEFLLRTKVFIEIQIDKQY